MKRTFFALSSIASIIAASSYAQSPAIDPVHNLTIDEKGRTVKQVKADDRPTLVNRLFDKNNNVSQYKIAQGTSAIQRYIVELNGAPVFKYQALSLKQKKYRTVASIEKHNREKFGQEITSYQKNIEKKQNTLARQITNIATHAKIIKQYQKVNNALVVEASHKDIEKIRHLANVKQITPERRFHVTLAESVPLINAPKVWAMKDNADIDVKGTGVTVAIIDTGVDYTHPALGGCIGTDCRVAAGYDFVNGDNDPMDGHGHGTHVAGIVGASSDDLTGVAPDVTLYAYKVLSDDGWGTNTDIIAAIEKAVDPDGDPLTDDAVDIINMSLGGGGEATGPLSTAVNNAVEAGVIVVVAAGNDGNYGDINTSSPANAEQAITVASSTKDDQLSYFSSKGLPDENYSLKPEITAPGSDIISTYLEGGTASLSGTSMASPHVAGAVALLKQLNPDLNTQQAKELLMAGAVDLDLDPLSQGAGRMDIEQSVLADSVLENGLINLGQVDKDASSWSSTKSLTIKNLSNVEQNYSISLPENFVTGATLSVDREEVTIPAFSSAIVEVSVNIEDVANFSYPDNSAGIFFDDIKISTENQQLTAKIVLDHAIILSINSNSPEVTDLVIQSDDSSFFSWSTIAPNSQIELRVPNKTLDMVVEYKWLNETHVPNNVPNDSIVFGYETYSLTINEDTELALDINDLTSVIGIQSIQGFAGETLPISSVYSYNLDTKFQFGSMNHSAGVFRGGQIYTAFGNLAANTQISFDSHYTLKNVDTGNDKHIYHLWHKTSAQNITDVAFNLDLNNDPKLETRFDNVISDNQEDIFLGVYKSGGGIISQELPDKVVVHSNTHESPDFTFTELALLTPNDNGWFDLLSSTNGMVLNQNSGFNKVNSLNETLLSTKQGEVNVYGEGVFWSASTDVDSSEVRSHDYNDSISSPNFVTDTLDNIHGKSLAVAYQWYCDQNIITGEDITLGGEPIKSYVLPGENCNELQIEFGFDSYLFGNKYRSTALVHAVENDNVPALQTIHLYEGENIVEDQILNKLSPGINVKFDYQQAQEITGEIRLDGGEWQAVNFSYNDEYGQSANIDMITGDHVVDLRLTYQSALGNAVVQTLNGFFKLGTESGSDNDLDDDGIPNGEDTDLDNDGVLNVDDLFPLDPSEAYDNDGDGVGNNADTDDDNDGVSDEQDAFPFDPTEWLDTDEDGIGNNADTDDDNDGVSDEQDAFPLDVTESVDTDGDGIGNNADTDDDNDGVSDSNDAYPLDPTRSQALAAVDNSSSGGGSFGFGVLLMLITLMRRRYSTLSKD